MTTKILQLHPLGYCAACKRPFAAGDPVADLRAPDGTTDRLHAACVGPSIEPPPTDGGTPIALAS